MTVLDIMKKDETPQVINTFFDPFLMEEVDSERIPVSVLQPGMQCSSIFLITHTSSSNQSSFLVDNTDFSSQVSDELFSFEGRMHLESKKDTLLENTIILLPESSVSIQQFKPVLQPTPLFKLEDNYAEKHPFSSVFQSSTTTTNDTKSFHDSKDYRKNVKHSGLLPLVKTSEFSNIREQVAQMENHQKLKDANVFDKMKKYSQNGIKSRISTENNKCGQTGKIHQRIQMMEKRNSPNVISEQHSKKFSTTPEDSSMLLQTISSPPASPKSRSSSPSSFHSSSSPSSDTSDVDEPVANTLRLWESRNSTQLITSPNADILRRKDLNWTIDQMVSALLREWRMNDRDDEWMTKKREEVWSEWRKMEQVAVTEEEKRQAEDKKQELLDRCLKEESMRKKIISSEIKQAKRFYATYGIWVMKNWASSKTEIRMWERAARKLNRKNKKLQEKQLEENNEFLYRIEELVNLEKKDCAHNNDKNEVCSFQSQSSTLCHDSKNLPSLDSAVSAQDKAGSNVLQIQLNESESQHSFKYTSFSSSSSPTTMTSSSSSVHLTLPLHSPFSCTSSISSPSHSSSRLIESQRQIFAQPSMPSVVNMTKDSENADYHCNEAEDLQATKCFSKKDGKEHSSQEMICDSKNNFSVGPLFDHPPPRPVVECTLLKENTDFSFIAPFKSYRSVDIRSSATNCSHSTLCHAQNTFQEKNNPPPRKKHGKVSLVLPVHQKPLFAAPLPYPQLSITSHISAAQPITFTMPPIPKVDLPIVFPNFFEF